jgi:hypothetical protein
MTDKLTLCPKCGCDGCYVTPINETKNSYLCWGCGFQTNDLMKEGEFDFESYEETLPELYKDIKYTDEESRVWYPVTINIEGMGTVFLNGTSKDNIQWSVIKTVLLTEEEKQQPKYKGKTYKSDPKSMRHFDNDFIEAADYLGLFDNTHYDTN